MKKATVLTVTEIKRLVKRRYNLIQKEDKSGEVAKISVMICDSFRSNLKLYPVDFVIETLTHFGEAPCLVYDDNGLFALSSDGFNPVVTGKQKIAGTISTFVEKKMWKPTIREAIKDYLTRP